MVILGTKYANSIHLPRDVKHKRRLPLNKNELPKGREIEAVRNTDVAYREREREDV